MRTFLQMMLRGQMLIEIMVALAISALFLPALLTGIVASQEGGAQQKLRFDATALLKEAEEAVRSVRNSGWVNIEAQLGKVTHPEIEGNNWVLRDEAQTINGFTREVLVDDVWRDGDGDIVVDGLDELDPSTLEIITTVSWTKPYSSSVSTTTYITRYENNQPEVDTTQAEFNNGTANGVTITNTSGGEILLGAGGHGDWCDPMLSTNYLDLSGQGIAKSVVATEGSVLTGTGENASGYAFIKINMPNVYPPNPNVAGYFNQYKTNEVFGEGRYAYMATDNNDNEVAIVDTSGSSPYPKIGKFDAGGNTSGKSVYVLNDIGYTLANDKLWNFDLRLESGGRQNSRPRLDQDGIDLVGAAATGKRVIVVGNYAYVAADDSAKALQIYNVGNLTNLTYAGELNVNNRFGKDIFVNPTGTRAYLVTSDKNGDDPDDDGNGQMYIIDVTNKSAPQLISNIGTENMRPRGVTVVPGNKAIVVGRTSSSQEYQVINIENETTPVKCGGTDYDYDIRAVASVLESDGDAYSFIVTKNSNREFYVIEGGPGGTSTMQGVFESATFATSSDVAFNRISFESIEPSQTDVKLQVAVADAVNNSCNGVVFTYVGPDKTANTYFTEADDIPLDDNGTGYENPGRCFRYKAFLSTSDSTRSPVLLDVTYNYSP